MKKIAIIEDEIHYQELLYDVLSRENYEVLKASNGKIGLELVEKEHPDLILLDIRMPIMDGITMLSHLRKNTYGKQANVILLSNLEPDDDLMEKINELKPTTHIVKSAIDLFAFLKKIHNLLAD